MRLFSSSAIDEDQVVKLVKKQSVILHSKHDLHQLFSKIGDARIVMLGEASHGTHDYYTWRSYITKHLVEEMGFNFIAVEGDWPDCYKINRYIKDPHAAETATDVLKSFDRWPTWMWANWEIAALTEWLRHRNNTLKGKGKTGFYGLDVYSLWESLDAIMKYLEKTDPVALEKAIDTFNCFEPYKEDGASYAYASKIVPELCENEVIELLNEIQKKIPQNDVAEEGIFSAEQNALVAVNAEKYYRAMVSGDADSWNIRDGHMEETLERLLDFHGPGSKAIVWAHNTHIGDSSATDMAGDGMYNIGELARTHFSGKTFLIGFGSYGGNVIAGNSWGAEMQHMLMPNARKGSWEEILHRAGKDNKLLFMEDFKDSSLADKQVGHRAIGVVYRPEFERYGNYVPSIIPARYDAFIYLNNTRALYPLHLLPHGNQVPETYPFGV